MKISAKTNPVLRKDILGILFTVLTPIYSYFVMEYMHFGSFFKLSEFLNSFIGACFFSLITLYLVFFILWFVVKKGCIASFIFIVIFSLISVINYFKKNLTGDFLYPWDIKNQTSNILSLIGFIKSGIPIKYIPVFLFGLVFPVSSYLTKTDIKIKFPIRAVISCVLCAVMLLFSNTGSLLKVFNMDIISVADQSTNYLINGFTGGFLVNSLSMKIKKPQGYTKKKAEKILNAYSFKASDNFSYPDIILVLSESFWDPKLLPNTEFSENPVKNFEEISKRENGFSGNMYQTAFGGGTVRTEFEVLTGLSSDYLPAGTVPWQYVQKDIPTFVKNYKSLGYRTIFLHTYLPTFYSRQKAYPHLGFDELYFEKELTSIPDVSWTPSGNYISDDSFVSYIEYLLQKNSNEPTFLFGISMENHQPYEEKYEKTLIKVKNDNLSADTKNIIENFATGIFMSDKALKKLVDFIDTREKETLLIYFGDHLPSLGQDKKAYTERGFISKDLTDEDMRKLMKTPFLLYSNFDIKKSETRDISSYNLINYAGELINAPKTPFMGFLTDFYNSIPYYNRRLNISLDEKQEEFVKKHEILTYDILTK